MKYGAIPSNPLERLALWAGKVPIPAIDAMYGIIKARAIMAGVRLGIFEAMREGDHSAPELAQRLGLEASALDLLLRTLVVADYLEQHGTGYRLSRLAQQTMVVGGRMEMFGFLEWNYTQWEFVEHLEELIRTGKGIEFHQTMMDPSAWAVYQRAMLEIARIDAPTVATKVPVPKGARSLLDIAGSHGLLGAAICRKHPPMRSTVIDLPAAVDHARRLAQAEGIADIVEHRAGDILSDDFGTGHDVALLSNILHHFKPEANQAILRRVRSALRGDGTVAIWEIERPRQGSKVTDGDGASLFFRLTSTAATYHGDEYGAWLTAAGFERVRVVRPALAPGSVLVIGRVGAI